MTVSTAPSALTLDLNMQVSAGVYWLLKKNVSFPFDGRIPLELIEVLQGDESYVAGDELIKRALSLRALQGQRCAEALLRHSDNIPEDWRPFILLFPGTVWETLEGDEYIPCLVWREGGWTLLWAFLKSGWHSPHRLVRICV